MHHIHISPTIKADASGYASLVELHEQIQALPGNVVMLHMLESRVFDANLSAVLGASLDTLVANGFEIYIEPPRDQAIKTSLIRNRFLPTYDGSVSATDPENFIAYRRFEYDSHDDFKEYIDTQLMRKQRFPRHTELAGLMIQESIMEIFVNAVHHGECAYVYSCGEYVATGIPPTLDMTIVDRGHSIPLKVNSYLAGKAPGTVLSDCDAIHWALKDGNTTKDIPGGLGLSSLLEFLTLNHGAMQIVSGTGMIEFTDGQFSNQTLPRPFPGTIVNMKFNFNDNNNYRLHTEDVNIENLL